MINYARRPDLLPLPITIEQLPEGGAWINTLKDDGDMITPTVEHIDGGGKWFIGWKGDDGTFEPDGDGFATKEEAEAALPGFLSAFEPPDWA